MSTATAWPAGSLVTHRGRDWVVLPSSDPELLLLQPLGGGEDEITGVWLPLGETPPRAVRFEPPSAADLGDFATARLLHDAARLALRHAAGPFRCLGKLSFRPRAYQLVPLALALRQPRARLLIADDVGVGKTVEALLIARELLERRLIRRFAVLCLPHLCEQWQAELRAKLDIEAVVLRSGTQARLDRQVSGDTSVYEHFPFQVVSLDFIKSDARREVFAAQAPELVIVDEAHACARPAGAAPAQQQRHHLVARIAARGEHLLLLSATPHSGKAEEFGSLLGLLRPGWERLDLPTATAAQRAELAGHLVQRRRADVRHWLGEDTPFPEREACELRYALSPAYLALFHRLLAFTRGLVAPGACGQASGRARFWAALGLLRGAMSSPAAGLAMLRKRLSRLDEAPSQAAATAHAIPEDDLFFATVADAGQGPEREVAGSASLQCAPWTHTQRRHLRELAQALQPLAGVQADHKLAATAAQLLAWLRGPAPLGVVVFCRYLETARYLGEHLAPLLQADLPRLALEVVTSELADEQRRQRIATLGRARRRVLVATDCLSEGVNLQEHFSAVLHYDLPWNPNRLEQREGRVDRFGQPAATVSTCLLYGADNPMDGVVLDVLLRKVREIHRATGLHVPFPEDSGAVADTIARALLLDPQRGLSTRQGAQGLLFDFSDDAAGAAALRAVDRELDEAVAQGQAARDALAAHALRPADIEADLREVDEALGDPPAVQRFILRALADLLGVHVAAQGAGWRVGTAHLPPTLREALPGADSAEAVSVSFHSPTPAGFAYLGRNHSFVERLCRLVLDNTLARQGPRAARAAVMRTPAVAVKTTLLLLRCRTVLAVEQGGQQLVAEEMLLWGWRGAASRGELLNTAQARVLLESAGAASDLSPQARAAFLDHELCQLPRQAEALAALGEARAGHLVSAHERFGALVQAQRCRVLRPLLPMDVLGVYVLLPQGPT
ncbi:helicase-related protein [Azohydromonas lata]|uniref:Helicase-related protein n=1 Tax=Azohydromonas lata TaxID=45677 RepID=A0ABU5IJI1_9BURK|nr:helicase-related protein [Azohydromonas lata]MDZ5459031.1 helicase-related protein [Azohydromonas lata]